MSRHHACNDLCRGFWPSVQIIKTSRKKKKHNNCFSEEIRTCVQKKETTCHNFTPQASWGVQLYGLFFLVPPCSTTTVWSLFDLFLGLGNLPVMSKEVSEVEQIYGIVQGLLLGHMTKIHSIFAAEVLPLRRKWLKCGNCIGQNSESCQLRAKVSQRIINDEFQSLKPRTLHFVTHLQGVPFHPLSLRNDVLSY